MQLNVLHMWKDGTTLVRADAVLPYGSVIAPSGSMIAVHLASALRLHLDNPWVPLIVSGFSSPDVPLFRDLGAHPDAIAVAAAAPANVAAVREIVRRRPSPTVDHLQHYIAHRNGKAAGSLVASALTSSRPPRLTTRGLVRHRLPPAEFWAPLLQILQALAGADATGNPQEVAAEWAGLTPRSASEACRRFFGLTWDELMTIGLWEVRLEIALGRAVSHSPSPWHGAALHSLIEQE